MTKGFRVILSLYRLGSSGERNEDNAACHYIADGLAGRYGSRLLHSKEAAKLVRGMYVTV